MLKPPTFIQSFVLFLQAGVLAALLSISAAAQSSLSLQQISTGHQPLGVGIVGSADGNNEYAVVANSGDNSVSIFNLRLSTQGVALTLSATVTGIPSPYGVAGCANGEVLVTSPFDNSVRLIAVPQGQVLATFKGSEPYSALCFTLPVILGGTAMRVAISNFGDSSLTIFDPNAQTLVATVPGVPGSRGFHGIGFVENQLGGETIGVAGASANVITLVDPVRLRVIGQIPVAAPTAVFRLPDIGIGFTELAAASSTGNTLFSFNLSTGTVDLVVDNVPSPQDAAITYVKKLNWLAIPAGSDSLWIDIGGNISTVAGIPGASSLAIVDLPPLNSADPENYGEAALVTGTKSNSLFAVYLPVNTPSQFVVQNAATPAGVAPGMLASAFAPTGVTRTFTAQSLPLPPTFGGVSLSIGGSLSFDSTAGKWNYSSTSAAQAPLLFVGPNQINFQVPPGIAPGSAVPAQLTKADGTTLLTALNITATAPGIFTVLQNGQGQAAVLNQDYSQNFGTNPAARGSVIQIFATGGGDTTPSLLPGYAADPTGNPLAQTNVTPTVFIGGVQAQVSFSGIAPGYAGLWQIDAVVPPTITPGSAVSLMVNAGGIASNAVTIAVQ